MVKPVSINDKLHFVIPIYGNGDSHVQTVIAYVHSAPISSEVFDAHFLLIGRTFSTIFSSGLGMVSGPRVAAKLLEKTARDVDDAEGGRALMNEIRRLSNVVLRSPEGWNAMQFQEVIDHELLDPDDISEAMNAIVFFIVTSAMQRRTQRRAMLDGAAKLWDAQITSSDFTVFAGSLQTSTQRSDTTKPLPASLAVY